MGQEVGRESKIGCLNKVQSLLCVIWLHGKQCRCMYMPNVPVSGCNERRKFYFSVLTEQLLILTKAIGPVGRADPVLLLNKSLTCCILSLLFSIMKSILQNVMETKLEN